VAGKGSVFGRAVKLNRTTNVLWWDEIEEPTTMEKKLEAQDDAVKLPIERKSLPPNVVEGASSSAQGTQSYLHSAGRD
jgi:hypothetical protein